MKKISLILATLVVSLAFISCDETTTEPIDETGTIFVDSSPQGAEIWLDDVSTNEVTPATINADAGVRTVTLKKEGFEDLIITISVTTGNESIITSNTLVAITVYFSTPVRIWETTGTTAAQPSGLDLSSGEAFGTSDVDNNSKIDIYYFSDSANNTYIVQSAAKNTNMTRETFFKISSASDLEDGEDSSVKDGNWVSSMGDREANYVFLYDADGHYSKLKIVNTGGGTAEPAWVEVAWVYNSVQDNTTF